MEYVANLVSAIRAARGPSHIGVARARSSSLHDDIAVTEVWSLGKEESSGGLAEGDISIYLDGVASTESVRIISGEFRSVKKQPTDLLWDRAAGLSRELLTQPPNPPEQNFLFLSHPSISPLSDQTTARVSTSKTPRAHAAA